MKRAIIHVEPLTSLLAKYKAPNQHGGPPW